MLRNIYYLLITDLFQILYAKIIKISLLLTLSRFNNKNNSFFEMWRHLHVTGDR